MSGWYSNIVGATTSKISNLQRSYFGGETDGDTEDDTHVCRVLRSYYIEKGKPFPGWLPPDPRAPPPAAAVYAQPTQVGARYGGLGQQQQGASLSSLWDNNPVSQPQESQSLRRGRGAPAPMRTNSPFHGSDPGNGMRNDIQSRPMLPSQRAGSHQTGGSGLTSTSSTGSGGGSAQDRLKQRLFGGSRTTSPSAGTSTNPPNGSRGGSIDYEDRFSSGGMHDSGLNRGGVEGRRVGGYSSGGRMR